MKHAILLIILCIFAGCSSIPLNDENISDCVHSRIDQVVSWDTSCEFENYICEAVKGELDVNHAVQIALLNNPDIQVQFENLGIAHADLVQAGLFHNPVFDFLYQFPHKSGFKPRIDYSVVFYFLDIFLVPLRKKIAVAEFEKVQMEISHAILDLAFEVEQTYYALIAERSRFRKLQAISELLEGAYEVACAQAVVGNIYEVILEKYYAESLSAKMEQRMSEIEMIHLKNHFNRLLGFENRSLCWELPPTLPHDELESFSLECLIQTALEDRLDLRAIHYEIEKIARTGSIKQWWAYTDIIAGISGEREIEGVWETGPAVGGAIPLFDYGQADRARLSALLRQNIEHYRSRCLSIENEVARIHESIETLDDMIQKYKLEILPAQKRIVEASQKLYNVMTMGTFELIENKKQEYLEEIHYMMTLRDYWTTRVQLKQAIGGKL